MWIKFKEGMFLFGEGGVNRVEAYTGFNSATQQPLEYTSLYIGTTLVGHTETSVGRIEELLRSHVGGANG